MKNMKSVLALLVAVCMLMCLAVSAFATETTGSAETTGSTETSAATDDTAAATDDTAAADDTTGAAEETTMDTTAADDHDHDHENATTTGAEEEGGFRKIARIILIVLEVIVSLALILVVLFQSGKESGLSGAISGSADTYLGKNGGGLDKKLATATKWVALIWVFVTLALSLI